MKNMFDKNSKNKITISDISLAVSIITFIVVALPKIIMFFS